MSHTASSPVSLPAPPRADGSLAEHPGADALRGRIMQRSLARQLDRVPKSRHALPYLAALEASLGRNGAAAIKRVPPHILRKIHNQLSMLPVDPTDHALRELLDLVDDAMQSDERRHTHQLSPFDPESTVVILEGSHTDFMDALDAEWPPRAAPAAP